MNKEQKMTRTTELLKEIEELYYDDGECMFSDNDTSQWKAPGYLRLKGELRGRLDALKEEVENLQKLGLIKIKKCSCFEHELMNDTYDLVYKRLASIQEEIKLIETAGVGK